MKLALVTDAASLPIDYDMPLLLDACSASGHVAQVCEWDDQTIDWAAFDAILLRSPWNCIEQLPVFFAWCDHVSSQTLLLNPVSVAKWGLNKLYLADISARGVPIIASLFVAPGSCPMGAWRDFFSIYPRTEEIVIKPTIGSYSRGVRRFRATMQDDAVAHMAQLLARGSHVMMQPYLPAFDVHGETDMVFFDAQFSHAIRKGAMLAEDGTVNVPTPEFRTARVPAADELAVGEAALRAAAAHLGLDEQLLYGRVDVVRSADGTPVVVEMEICEPSLNLPFGEGSAHRLVQAVAARVLNARQATGASADSAALADA